MAGLALGILVGFGAQSPAHAAWSSSDIATAQRAFVAADAGNWIDAEAAARGVADPLVLKLIRWEELQKPNSGADFNTIRNFVTANPDWPHQRLLVLRAEAVMDGVDPETLRQWFKVHPPISPLAKLRLADLIGATDPAGRLRLIREAWIGGNFSDRDAARVLQNYGSVLTVQDHEKRMDRLLWDGHVDQAIFMLNLVPPDWQALARARYRLATSAKDAEAAYARVPAHLKHNPGLLFDRMRWFIGKGRDEDAAAILESSPEDLGRPETWWSYRQSMARRLVSDGNSHLAYRILTNAGDLNSASQADADFTAGWIALRFLKNPSEAYDHFVHLHDQSSRPISLSRGAYWAGRAAAAMGRSARALQWYKEAAKYPTTYYGQLAASQPGVLAPVKPVPEPRPSEAALAAFMHQEQVQAILLLNAVGEQETSRAFFFSLMSESTARDDYMLLADFAESIGRADLGVAVAKQASYKGVVLLRAGYPIVPMPRNAGAEQALMLALTRQESAFDQFAVSRTGARGLMQLEPGTAKLMAKNLGLPYSLDRLTQDPTYNVTLGQAYFDTLIGTFNGSYVLAIASYNAGPARVQQWLAQYGDPRSPNVDAIDWVEEIPFAETRNYVQRVLENLQVYRLRIGNPALAFSLQTDLRR
ncbi:MAG TPA: lytic transglycosylase domain-containing protein [Stellaceae bacterium]|nr:lytic transglycosylase domain-containing protein [Stellaceae bacterium]